MLPQTHLSSKDGLASFVLASPEYELAPIGIGSFREQADRLADFGRNGDVYVVHAAEGETVVPMEVLEANPQVKELLFNQMRDMGLDPNEYVVGDNLNSINPYTGMPEFFFKGIFKAVKGVLGVAAPMIAGAVAGPAGAMLAQAFVSRFVDKRPWADVLKRTAATYALGAGLRGIGASLGGTSFGRSLGFGATPGGPTTFLSGLKSGLEAPFTRSSLSKLNPFGGPGGGYLSRGLKTLGQGQAGLAAAPIEGSDNPSLQWSGEGTKPSWVQTPPSNASFFQGTGHQTLTGGAGLDFLRPGVPPGVAPQTDFAGGELAGAPPQTYFSRGHTPTPTGSGPFSPIPPAATRADYFGDMSALESGASGVGKDLPYSGSPQYKDVPYAPGSSWLERQFGERGRQLDEGLTDVGDWMYRAGDTEEVVKQRIRDAEDAFKARYKGATTEQIIAAGREAAPSLFARYGPLVGIAGLGAYGLGAFDPPKQDPEETDEAFRERVQELQRNRLINPVQGPEETAKAFADRQAKAQARFVVPESGLNPYAFYNRPALAANGGLIQGFQDGGSVSDEVDYTKYQKGYYIPSGDPAVTYTTPGSEAFAAQYRLTRTPYEFVGKPGTTSDRDDETFYVTTRAAMPLEPGSGHLPTAERPYTSTLPPDSVIGYPELTPNLVWDDTSSFRRTLDDDDGGTGTVTRTVPSPELVPFDPSNPPSTLVSPPGGWSTYSAPAALPEALPTVGWPASPGGAVPYNPVSFGQAPLQGAPGYASPQPVSFGQSLLQGAPGYASPQFMNYGGAAQYPRREMLVEGPGTERSDDIPAMLSDGEFVLNARSVRGADPTGRGDRYRGARNLYDMMRNFEMRA